MPADRPAIASCPHCGALLFWTPEGAVHPMPGERDRIRDFLETHWFHHAGTSFDGRFHQCLGSVQQVVADGRRIDSARRKRSA